MTDEKNEFELVIRPQKGLFSIDLPELMHYRELLYFLTWREVKVRYKQTIMGASWALLQPLFTMIVFTLIFGGLAKMPSEGIPYPVFSYSGLLLWIYFSNSVSSSGNSLVGNSALISKIYFPRLFIPTSACLSGLVDYVIALVILVFMMIYYNLVPNVSIIMLPLLVFTTLILASGIGYWLSSISVKYRDVHFILPFFIQLFMFISPVIYPTNIVGEKYQWLLYLNPMTGLIDAHRAVLLGHMPVNFGALGISMVISVVIFLSGIMYLKKTEKYFADLI
ncbi:MAG: ABC transporter permease [Methanosarcinales archaeon]|nr:ABC transporter permease [ANME-2 cluster archaeon]MDF1531729.1 ABC transporter permease [ANME-2 cluster archaeon]MDW7776629.1 ABC transporter permease [Methanosarcinales archaeon]